MIVSHFTSTLRYIGSFCFLIFLVAACKKGAPDGSYCADVAFKNAGTNKITHYNVLVEVKDRQLSGIRFPEGHYDTSAIPLTIIPDDGKCTLVSGMGQMYTIEMKGSAEKCLNASNMVQCLGHAKGGNRCKRMTDKPNGYCWQHQEQASQIKK